MNISIEWEHGRYTGNAIVLEPCCSIKKDERFNVLRENGQLYAYLSQGYEDAIFVPFNYCPSCGSRVQVVSEIELAAPARGYGTIQSGLQVVVQSSNVPKTDEEVEP